MAPTAHALPLTAIILTLNEEKNLSASLESLRGLAAEIFVVDSGSTDGTPEVGRRHGARVVSHPFETHARQWQWSLANLPLTTEWVLALDADQRLTPGLRDEIADALTGEGEGGGRPAGYYLKRKQIFRGRWIKHGGYYPKYLLKLFRRAEARVDGNDLVDHHFRVTGEVRKLHGDLVEDNRNERDILVWVVKHARYAALQARQEFETARPGGRNSAPATRFGSPDDRVRWLKNVWARLPLYVRPCLYFFYRYIVRLGFLDGKEGFVFHALQAFWYRLLVDVNLDELRRVARDGIACTEGRDQEADGRVERGSGR